MKRFGRSSEAEWDAEIRSYLELSIDENLRAGMMAESSPPRGAAEGMAQVKERCREVRPFHWLTGLWQTTGVPKSGDAARKSACATLISSNAQSENTEKKTR